MDITVNNCNNCPLRSYHFDDFAMGDMEVFMCDLIQYKNRGSGWNENSNPYIKFFKNGKVKSANKRTLDNCPLLTSEINIKSE
jgi:hypothetical protein